MMNIVLDSQEYLLANNQFAIGDDQPQAVFSPVNKIFNARVTADVGGFSATSFTTWLEYLRAVSLQVFAISILVAVSHFAHADTTSPLANSSSLARVTYLAKPQAEWLPHTSLLHVFNVQDLFRR